jgi:hypothetical protein
VMMLTGARSSGGRCTSVVGGMLGAGARTTGVARGVIILIDPACYPARTESEAKIRPIHWRILCLVAIGSQPNRCGWWQGP